MTPFRILIADDEPIARSRLQRLLKQFTDYEVVGEAVHGPDAIQRIRQLRPDIVLLDVQMPGADAFEVLGALGDMQMATVLVTAFDQHALRAFDAAVVDYVTKPVMPDRLAAALARARARVEAGRHRQFVQQFDKTATRHLWVKANTERVRLRVDDIEYIKAERDYSRLFIGGASYLYGDGLATLENQLDMTRFIRVHRSTIVQISAVRKMRTTKPSSSAVVLRDGTEISIGRTYARQVRRIVLEQMSL